MLKNDPKFPGQQNPKFRAPMADHPSIASARSFDEYKDRYAANFMLERTDDGIMTAKWHTNGGELEYGIGFHRGVGQLMEDIGQDSDTEVLIMGGTGETFLKKHMSLVNERPNMEWYSYEHMFMDGTRMVGSLVNSLRIPTIGVINGDGYHTEIALLCDLTLMAEDAVISDPHFVMGGVPGDGIQTAFRKTMGLKRANYAMYMNEQIDAQTALEYGMVNEVLPREKIYDRAKEIAKFMMTKPRVTRRIISEIVKQPWQKSLAEELRPNFGMEMWTFFTNAELDHDSGFAAIEEWKKVYQPKKK